MSSKTNWDLFNKHVNSIMDHINMNLTFCKGSYINSCCDDGNDESCDDCSCDDNKKSKPNSQTLRDDGCYCRKCNDWLAMAEPDDKKDGKTLCYRCANRW
jgi:hypothetical protein